MGQLENYLKNKYERTLTKYQRLWRCNSGTAWGGKLVKNGKSNILTCLRKILLWPVGTPDSIGFDSIIITPEMVGKRVAVFVGTEIKTGKQQLNPDQIRWRDKILIPMGAIHREVRDGEVIQSGFF